MNLNDYIAEREERDPAFREASERLRSQYEYRRALIKARLEAGLTQAELAERLGMKQSAIARLESGRSMPTVETLHRLASVLGVDFLISAEAALTVQPRTAA